MEKKVIEFEAKGEKDRRNPNRTPTQGDGKAKGWKQQKKKKTRKEKGLQSLREQRENMPS